MAKHTEKSPEFDAMQWTGSNQAEVAAFVATYRGANLRWSVREDGGLYGAFDMDWLLIPRDHWFVVGPIWGDEDPADVRFKTVPAAAFTKRFDRKN